MSDKLQIELSGVKLANPVIPASGTYGFGYRLPRVSSFMGGISFIETI